MAIPMGIIASGAGKIVRGLGGLFRRKKRMREMQEQRRKDAINSAAHEAEADLDKTHNFIKDEQDKIERKKVSFGDSRPDDADTDKLMDRTNSDMGKHSRKRRTIEDELEGGE